MPFVTGSTICLHACVFFISSGVLESSSCVREPKNADLQNMLSQAFYLIFRHVLVFVLSVIIGLNGQLLASINDTVKVFRILFFFASSHYSFSHSFTCVISLSFWKDFLLSLHQNSLIQNNTYSCS